MNHTKENNRESKIIRASLIGILTNVLLSAFKAVIGLLSGSIAILLDAVNNLSDALSSVITILGMKLAGKPADKKHPFGHGRTEYLTSMLIAGIILLAGITSIVESAKKIAEPEAASYSAVTFLIIIVAVFAKLFLGHYVKKTGKEVNSDSLIASGADATFDAVISISTLISGIITIVSGFSIDGYLGVVISAIILKAGIEMLSGTLSDILGERADPALTRQIKSEVMECTGVLGAYDLQLHSYGPEKMIGAIHIAVYDTMTAKEIQDITKEIQHKILASHGIFLTVGIYASNTRQDEAQALQQDISALISAEEHILSMHAFYVNYETRLISFDIVVSFKAASPSAVKEKVRQQLALAYPDFTFEINTDVDFSD